MKTTGVVVIGIAAIILAAAIIQVATAVTEVRSGPGWNLTVSETPVIDPSTGVPYRSAGELLEKLAPDRWAAMSPELQARYDREPAVQRRIDLRLTPDAQQRNLTRMCMETNSTRGEFYATVYPDLWIVLPDWQKEIWENQTLSGGYIAATPTLDGPVSAPSGGMNRTEAGAPGSSTSKPAADIQAPENYAIESSSRSGMSIDGSEAAFSTTTTPAGTSTHVSHAIGTVSAFASAHSRSRSSSLDYEKFTSASGIIDHFDFSFQYSG